MTSQNWFPDTSATDHATPDIHDLSTSEDYVGTDTLRVGDSKALSIASVGHTSFSTPSRFVRMSRALHVPKLSTSLLFVQKFTFENNVFFLISSLVFSCEGYPNQGCSSTG